LVVVVAADSSMVVAVDGYVAAVAGAGVGDGNEAEESNCFVVLGGPVVLVGMVAADIVVGPMEETAVVW
jgi:hypothetical protein